MGITAVNRRLHVLTLAIEMTILGVTNAGGGHAIEDDLTTPFTKLTDVNVGMYIVGEALPAASGLPGYSRFTTSASVPTWLVGTGAPTGTSCATGTLYSRTSGGTGTKTIYGCAGGTGWTVIQ